MSRCSSSLTARVSSGSGRGAGRGGVAQHSHQEMARVTAGGSLLRAGAPRPGPGHVSLVLGAVLCVTLLLQLGQ